MSPHTPIFKPNAALTARKSKDCQGLGVRGPTGTGTCTLLVPLNLPADACTACIERFANGVRWREGERLVPHRGLPLPNPPTWHRSPCSPD
jgi:hypothetical protein